MSYTNLTQDEIETMTLFFEYIDSDHDGFVTVNEIKEACSVDIDADGTISEQEKNASAAPWIGALASQDQDGDQRLSLHELLMYNSSSKGTI